MLTAETYMCRCSKSKTESPVASAKFESAKKRTSRPLRECSTLGQDLITNSWQDGASPLPAKLKRIFCPTCYHRDLDDPVFSDTSVDDASSAQDEDQLESGGLERLPRFWKRNDDNCPPTPSTEEPVTRHWTRSDEDSSHSSLREEDIPTVETVEASLEDQDEFRQICADLRKVAALQDQYACNAVRTSNISKAGVLCMALGDVVLEEVPTPGLCEEGIDLCISAMQAFSLECRVYSAACYALANILRRTNVFTDENKRFQIADWISHVTSFNVRGNAPPGSPGLARASAAAARNFVWGSAKNAGAFLSSRRAGVPLPVETLHDSMAAFRSDTPVVAESLSAMYALARFPHHQKALVDLGLVRIASGELQRRLVTENVAVLTFALAILGHLVAHPTSPSNQLRFVREILDEKAVWHTKNILEVAVKSRAIEVIEESLSTILSFSRFDLALLDKVLEIGTVEIVIRAVWCLVEGGSELVTWRGAVLITNLSAELSSNASAAIQMRRSNLDQPLRKVISRYPAEPHVSRAGNQALEQFL